eukprot:227555_1
MSDDSDPIRFWTDQMQQQAMSNSTNWTTMSKFGFSAFSTPIQISNKQFVVLPSKNQCRAGDGVYKYNIDHNIWTKILDYDKDFVLYSSDIAFNKESQSIYTWLGSTSLHTFNLKTKQSQTIATFKHVNGPVRMIFIHGRLHLIIYQRHFVWNEQNKEEEEIHRFQPVGVRVGNGPSGGYGLIFLESVNKLLLIGGGGWNGDLIYEFCMKNKTWHKWNNKLPKTLQRFGVVSTRDDQYLIILGGSSRYGWEPSDDIFICDMRKKTKCFVQSKIKCPFQKPTYHNQPKFEYNAFITNNIEKDNLLCFGFIAHCFKAERMMDAYLSLDVVQLIVKYIFSEDVYLMKRDTGHLYKMNVNDILQSLYDNN